MNRIPPCRSLCRWFVTLVACCALVPACASNRPVSQGPDADTVAPAEAQSGVDPNSSAQINPGPLRYDSSIRASVVPPRGWKLDVKNPKQKNVKHHVWISPTGRTAFGVMRFTLPLPLPYEPVLWAFIAEMRKSEGDAEMLSKVWDKALPGVRFEAEGGRYRLRTNLTIRGLNGWMSYAGTLRDQPVDEAELKAAVEARERTRFEGAP